MPPTDRKEEVLAVLKNTPGPQSASNLAGKFGVSRQIIVGDIALLRASGENITATPKGYVYEDKEHPAHSFGFVGTLACRHSIDTLQEELYTVVDYGGTVLDVTIEHPVYGQLSGQLDVRSRYDADLFMETLEKNQGQPLCSLTGGIHLHRIGCRDQSAFLLIAEKLKEKKIALS